MQARLELDRHYKRPYKTQIGGDENVNEIKGYGSGRLSLLDRTIGSQSPTKSPRKRALSFPGVSGAGWPGGCGLLRSGPWRGRGTARR